jgi:RHS repeat-associated protein
LQDDLGLDLYDYGARHYDPALGRFTTQDAFTEKYIDFTPYQYAANNPILFIDVNGDSTYTYNMATGALTMVSDVGGNEQQIVNFVDADGNAIMLGDNPLTSIIDGESVFVTETREGTLVSAYDPLEYLSEDYNSKSGYEYTASDLVVRHKLKGSRMGGLIAGQEASGNAGPLAGDTYYDAYVEKWGTDKAFWSGIEGGYFSNILPAGGTDILSGTNRTLLRSANNKSINYNPNFSKVKSPIKNSWNRYLHANKGSGKSIQELAKEYNRLMKGK